MSKSGRVQFAVEETAYYGGVILKWVAIIIFGGLVLFALVLKSTWNENLWPLRARIEELKEIVFGKMLPKPCWENRDACDADGNLIAKPKPIVIIKARPPDVKQPSVTASKMCADKPGLVLHCQMQATVDYFNKTLFDGALPPVSVTFRTKKTVAAYYWHNRFKARNGKRISELAMDMKSFKRWTPIKLASVIVHEQCHQLIAHQGKSTRISHNKAWGDCMVKRGLQPSSTGRPGGRTIGKRMSHFIPKNSRFRAVAKQSPLLKMGGAALVP